MFVKKVQKDTNHKSLKGYSTDHIHDFQEHNPHQEESEFCPSWLAPNSCPKCGRKMRLIGERYQYDDPYEYTWYECLRCGCTVEKV